MSSPIYLMSEQAVELIASAMLDGAHAQVRALPEANTAIPVRVTGNIAEIPVKGALFAEPSWIHALFGIDCTTYAGLSAALAQANGDPRVSSIRLAIDSPGGDVSGLFTFMDQVAANAKPVDALVQGECCSAAYGIASQCRTVTASNDGDVIGSVGVRTVALKPDGRAVHITSSAAPKKVPDVSTEEGVGTVREFLDQTHELFAGRIARGRNTTPGEVNAAYGQGGIMTAHVAIQRGMIDQIQTIAPRGSLAGGNRSTNKMDLSELKAAHPQLCAELVAEGVSQERDRVAAHAKLGREFACGELALGYIEDGAALGATQTAAYMVAANRSRELANRDADAAPQTNAAPPVVDLHAEEDAQICAAYLARKGN